MTGRNGGDPMRAFLMTLWSARRAIMFYLVLIGLGWGAGYALQGLIAPDGTVTDVAAMHRMMVLAVVVYILAAAIPFVPGAELGFALLLLFGKPAAIISFTGMVGALMLSFCVARFVSPNRFARLLAWMHMRRAAAFVAALGLVPPHERADYVMAQLTDDSPLWGTRRGRLGATLLRNRYVLLVLLLNLPGNSVLGGGGGLAFLAGMSGLYGLCRYFVSVLIAVAPLPLIVYLWGG
ncbi:hypothetical protein [Aliiroseovarius lamellibrachiae]|uniref:hypothetical protein n=1 Tax=Aliiroseovarius lamellibrachiae TaxID=1924933 RepID=UPI001BE00856|nr:hypothetical protein [Aliiroseovarius lamellibrachiae]